MSSFLIIVFPVDTSLFTMELWEIHAMLCKWADIWEFSVLSHSQ